MRKPMEYTEDNRAFAGGKARMDDKTQKESGRSLKRGAIGKVLFAIVLFAATALLVSATPLFSITGIEVSGNHFYDKSQIVIRSGLHVGQNGFAALRGGNPAQLASLRCAQAEREVASACPYIKAAHVRYMPPHTIIIDVEERSKSVVVPYFESGLIIDEEGVVVDIVKDYRLAELPVAYGLPVSGYEMGELLAAGDKAGVGTVLELINAIRQVDRDSDEVFAWKIDSIDISDPRNVKLALNNGISVNLGDGSDLYYRLSMTKEIVAHGIGEGEPGEISFSNGARPVFAPG